jgi:hypothetical protein
MIVAIHAYEGIYCGLHGIEDFLVAEVENLKVAEDIALDLANGVIDDYGYDFDEEDLEDPDLEWEIYEVTDTKGKTAEELDEEYHYDPEGFLTEYNCV